MDCPFASLLCALSICTLICVFFNLFRYFVHSPIPSIFCGFFNYCVICSISALLFFALYHCFVNLYILELLRYSVLFSVLYCFFVILCIIGIFALFHCYVISHLSYYYCKITLMIFRQLDISLPLLIPFITNLGFPSLRHWRP